MKADSYSVPQEDGLIPVQTFHVSLQVPHLSCAAPGPNPVSGMEVPLYKPQLRGWMTRSYRANLEVRKSKVESCLTENSIELGLTC